VTALFSDLSGYTAMSERLDPEEVKEITGKIFDEEPMKTTRCAPSKPPGKSTTKSII
jgi:hypothetical protein